MMECAHARADMASTHVAAAAASRYLNDAADDSDDESQSIASEDDESVVSDTDERTASKSEVAPPVAMSGTKRRLERAPESPNGEADRKRLRTEQGHRAPAPSPVTAPVPTAAPEDSDDDEVKPKPRRVTGNKMLADPLIPPKPVGMQKQFGVTSNAGAAPFDGKRRFHYRLIVTNAQSLLKFLSGIVKVIPEIRIHLVYTKSFQGFRIEAHDGSLSIAAKSRYQCDLVPGTDEDGAALDETTLNGISFCVTSAAFALSLDCAAAKETNMHITAYHATAERPTARDELTFETVTDEGVAYGVFYCRTITTENLKSLANIKVKASFHQEISLTALKNLCANAKKANAPIMTFCVARCEDAADPAIMHTRLSIGFVGDICGEQNFFLSMRVAQAKHQKDGKEVADWQMVPNVSSAHYASLDWTQLCENEYDSKKLRVFLRSMEGEWAWVHLSNRMPLIMEISAADKSTQHMIIIAPRDDGDAPTA